MKKVLYGLLIAAALAVPTRPLELGKLKPMEVIRIDRQGEFILLETDTGDSGRGRTVEQAIWNLRETTAGTVYLDTAEYVLLPEQHDEVLTQLTPYLKKSMQLCRWTGEIELEKAAKYLDNHSPNMRLKDYRPGMPLKVLKGEKGGLRLQEKNIERREKTS